MIRNVLLMATSGLVLFSKEFANAIAQPRLIGSLLTAMVEFSIKTTGVPVSFMEFTTVAVSIVTNENAKVFCAMFYDVADGPKFGAFIATEFLKAFIEEYARDLGNLGHNLRDFHGFHYKISQVIRDSIKPILAMLQQERGIQKAILVTEDSVTHTTSEVDQLGVLVNLQSLRNLASNMMAFVGDNAHSVTIQAARNCSIQVSSIETNATLVVAYNQFTFLFHVNNGKAEKALAILAKLNEFALFRPELATNDQLWCQGHHSNAMEVLIERCKTWEASFRSSIDRSVEKYQEKMDELEFLIATDAELDEQLKAMCALFDGFESNSVSSLSSTNELVIASEGTRPKRLKRKAEDTPEMRKMNRFQYRQREEILRLREDVQVLQARLKELHETASSKGEGWAAAAREELMAKTRAMQENATLKEQVSAQMTFIESMSSFLHKKPALKAINTSENLTAEWTQYKLAAQNKLRIAAIHAIADRQYARQQTAFINAGVFEIPLTDTFKTSMSLPPDGSLLVELAMHRKYNAPFRVVANAFWHVVNGDAAPVIPEQATRTIEKIDKDTIYQTYRDCVDGIPVHLNLIYKQYDEPNRRVYSWRSVVEDALMPNMLSGALGIQWGWVVVQPCPSNDRTCEFTFLRYINNGRAEKILEVIPRLEIFKFCRQELGDESLWKGRRESTMEVLMEQGKRWEVAFRQAIDKCVEQYQNQLNFSFSHNQ
ncbi:hypothetical protein THRCLA_06929 [Thraustotheca clavata]|uniref:Uncharacterized protein n=1 Tax=Thraustotheca clavata TaxID=74557 RepID=A0A1V9ZHN7_9STRA|nr:hypothetical protein THRCLA_06929 [Thraustotheca clavata]